MRNSFWFAWFVLILAMGMPTAWGQTWGQIPDNIEIKFAPLMDRTEDRFSGEIRSNREHVEISADGFGMKLQEGRTVYYRTDQGNVSPGGRKSMAVAFNVIVSTNWNNLNLRYYVKHGTAQPGYYFPFINGRWRNTIASRTDYIPFTYNIPEGSGFIPESRRVDVLYDGSWGLYYNWGNTRTRYLPSVIPKQPITYMSIPILDDAHPEPDETFTVVFEENSDDPQYGWTFTVTIKDNDPERIPNVAFDVLDYVVSTNFGRLVKIPEDPRQVFVEFPEDPRQAFEQATELQEWHRWFEGDGVDVIRPIFGATRDALLSTDSGPLFNVVSNIVSSGSVPIPVELTVATGRTAVSVDYATQDDTAIAGQDYIETRGTLTFQPGETRHYLSVPIIDDGLNETNEFFNVVLSNPTNSGLSLRRTVKVQILDDDGPVAAPVTNVDSPPLSPIVTSTPSGEASLMLESSSLSLAEGESDTYKVRSTADPIRDMTVNLETAHSGITLNPSRLLFTSDNWQSYKTVTVTASADAADIGEQASIRHSIPFREGFPANNNAGTVSVTLAHTLVEAGSPSPSSSETREIDFQPTAAILLTDYDLAWDDDGSLTVGGQAFPINLTNLTLPIGLREIDFQPTSQVRPIDYDFGSNLALNNDGSLILVAVPSIGPREIGFQPTSQVRSTDYDQDDDGLIEISNLAQLNAIRWDLDGDGQPDKETFAKAYNQAFPSAIDNPQAQGYELAGDLDFGDNLTSWQSIGVFSQPFQAVFEGNEHTIYNLFQDQSDPALFYNKPSGLFGAIGNRGQVVNVGLEGVQIKGVNFVGALAGFNQGSIGVCSALDRVEGVHGVGGLVGQNFGDIRLSIAEVEVHGVSGVGDLVGIDTMAR